MRLVVSILLAVTLFTGCSTSLRERRRVIHARPDFQHQNFGKMSVNYLAVPRHGSEPDLIYWPKSAPGPVKLDAQKNYTIELIERPERGRFLSDSTIYWNRELLRMRDGSQTLFDASVCERHHARMERVPVPILYGMPDLNSPFLRARRSFPNHGKFTFGGCCVSPHDPKFTRGWRCPICAEAARAWDEKHSGNRN